METSIYSNQINPFVRFAGKREYAALNQNRIYAQDCRIFYFIGGSCEFCVGDESFDVAVNDLFIIPPQTPYNIVKGKNISYYLLNFDYLRNSPEIEYAIPISDMKSEPHQMVRFLDLVQLNKTVCLNVSGLTYYFEELKQLYMQKDYYFHIKMNIEFSNLLIRLFGLILHQNSEQKIIEIMKFVSEHSTEHLTNAQIGELFSYHPNYVNRLFVQYSGFSLHRYMLNSRIEKAIELLESTDSTIAEIAEDTGWNNLSQFSRCFKSVTGYPPSRFRQGKE